MSDAAHTALEARLDEARTAWHAAFDAGQLDLADLAYTQLNDLLDAYIHLPLQRQGP